MSNLFQVGDKPGRGRYMCVECKSTVVLNSNEEALPLCGKCGEGARPAQYRRIDKEQK